MAKRKNMMIALPPPEVQQSIYIAAEQHAYAHKWIESEKAHRDLGDIAFIDWYRRYWWIFCRERLLEHLLGIIFWKELDDHNFGLIGRRFAKDDELIAAIVQIFQRGGENLDIVQYALANNLNMGEVLLRLEIFDINAARIVPNVTITEMQFVSKISERRCFCGLLVDPDAQTRAWLGKILSAKNITVIEAVNAETASAEIAKRHYDIFFVELDLPDNFGTEIADKLLRHNINVPVIAMTSRAADWNDEDLKDCGFTEMLTKPLSETRIAEIISELDRAFAKA